MKSKTKNQSSKNSSSEETSPARAKAVLFVFGVGPLLIMIIFLAANGFFDSPIK